MRAPRYSSAPEPSMIRIATFLAFLTVLATSALAQLPAASDAAAEQNAATVMRLEKRVHFDNDGTGYDETTSVVRILNAAGVQAYGQLAFGYNSGTEKLEVGYVRVRKPSGEVIE